MKRVIQEHKTGCGIACVAMLCRSSYSEVFMTAKEVLGWTESQRSFYTSSSDLQTLLHTMKVKARKGRSVRKWSSLPEVAIIGINYNEKAETWHWVVFRREIHEEYVLDPQSKRDIRKDFSRMRLRSCIPIDLKNQ